MGIFQNPALPISRGLYSYQVDLLVTTEPSRGHKQSTSKENSQEINNHAHFIWPRLVLNQPCKLARFLFRPSKGKLGVTAVIEIILEVNHLFFYRKVRRNFNCLNSQKLLFLERLVHYKRRHTLHNINGWHLKRSGVQNRVVELRICPYEISKENILNSRIPHRSKASWTIC